MKLMFIPAVTIAVCSSALGVPQDKPAKQSGTAEQAVMRIEKEILDAVLKGNPGPSERYMADTFIFIGPDGLVQDKAENIADLKTGDLKLQSATLDDAKVSGFPRNSAQVVLRLPRLAALHVRCRPTNAYPSTIRR